MTSLDRAEPTDVELIEAERQLRRQTEMLLELSRTFSSAGTAADVYSALAAGIHQILGTDAVSIVVQEPSQSPTGLSTVRRVAAVGMNVEETAERDRILVSHTSLTSTIDRIASASRDPVIVPVGAETIDDDRLRECFVRYGVTELLAAPITVAGDLHGVLYTWSRYQAVRLDPGNLTATATMVRHAASSIERLLLLASERNERARAGALLSFARRLNMSIGLDAVTDAIIETLNDLFPNAVAGLALDRRDESGGFDVTPEQLVEEHEQFFSLLRSVCESGIRECRQVGAATVVASPLAAGSDVLGVMLVVLPGDGLLSDAEHALLDGLAPQAADAIHRAKLFSVAERHIAELTLLQEVGRTIATRQNPQEIFEYIASEIGNVVDHSAGLIALESRTSGFLEAVAVWGDIPQESHGMQIPIDESILGSVYRSHKPVVVSDVGEHPNAFDKPHALWRSLISVPLMTGNRSIGAMLLGHRVEGVFSQEDVRLTSLLASQAGAAIYQAREAERQRELYRAGVEALAAAVDAKDSYAHSHSRQVAEFSRRTAEALGLRPEEVERIELAGLLHDVGKIGIPDHILTKPGRLDPQERLIMIGHATLGARIVAAHPSLAMMSNLVLHHHEWHNGSGYPDGLRGDDVPLGSAIIAVADAFDSMTSFRPYRSPLSYEEAREELVRWSGTQFNPVVVEAFLATLGEDPQPQTGTAADRMMKLEPIQALDVIAPRVLSQIATEITHLTDLYPFLDRVQQIVCQELRYDEVHILLADDSNGQLTLAASTTHADLVGLYHIFPGEGITGEAALTRQVVNCGDLSTDPRARPTDLGERSMIAVPLILDDQVIGVLGSGSAEPERYEDRDVALMIAIAGQIGPTIRVAQLHDHAKRAATTDGLTGVMNHRAFYQRLETMIAELDTWDEDLHLLIVDVIGLKAVNDIHGHLAGDSALKAIANALKSRVRGEDEVARYGGDEFVVIVRGTPRAGLKELVDRITAPVEFKLGNGQQMTVRLRSGVATAHSSAERSTELVARADAGLYSQVQPTERRERL